MVQLKIVLANRGEMVPPEHGNGALPVGDGGNAAEQSALGAEELPAVAGGADHVDPKSAAGETKISLMNDFRSGRV